MAVVVNLQTFHIGNLQVLLLLLYVYVLSSNDHALERSNVVCVISSECV